MSATAFHILFYSASGYGLFSVLESEEIGSLLQEVQTGQMICPFSTWLKWRHFIHLIVPRMPY